MVDVLAARSFAKGSSLSLVSISLKAANNLSGCVERIGREGKMKPPLKCCFRKTGGIWVCLRSECHWLYPLAVWWYIYPGFETIADHPFRSITVDARKVALDCASTQKLLEVYPS